MAMYSWDINNIKNNISDSRKVESLSDEYNNIADKETENIFNRTETFRSFKKQFRRDFITMCRISEEMTEYTFELFKKVNLKDLAIIELPSQETEDEILVSNIIKFFEYLGDKDILKQIKDLLNPNNHYLSIKSAKDDQMAKIVRGRVIKGEDKQTVYGSFYKKGTDEDIVILTHEIGHMLSHRLFGDNQNPITQLFLTEVESYYMELLMGYYLGEVYDREKLAQCFRTNRLTKIIDNAWDIHIQAIMDSYMLCVNYKGLDKDLKKEGYIHDITPEDFKLYTKIKPIYKAKMINSYMVAIELFRRTIEDKEKGIETYKKLFTSDITDYNKLLKKYKLNYLENDDTFNCMLNESKELKKIFTNM